MNGPDECRKAFDAGFDARKAPKLCELHWTISGKLWRAAWNARGRADADALIFYGLTENEWGRAIRALDAKEGA